jgi:protein-S-isoprenylcysteine O-methyltransferase Ste14
VTRIPGECSRFRAPLRPYSVAWLSRLRAAKGYELAVRALGSGWFLFLALASGLTALTHAKDLGTAHSGPAEWTALLASACLLLFYLVLWWLMLLRPQPIAQTEGFLPSLNAFAGTYLPWTIVLFAQGVASTGQKLASAMFLLFGSALMVVVICHLGRAFSIVPQARRLVRTGPYAMVRNPLYLAEEVALLGMLLQFYSLVTLIVLLAHGALQIRRIFYEESLLRRVFPDYGDYARSTSRLVPYIW